MGCSGQLEGKFREEGFEKVGELVEAQLEGAVVDVVRALAVRVPVDGRRADGGGLRAGRGGGARAGPLAHRAAGEWVRRARALPPRSQH